jgi:hypothetical protein
MTVVAFTRTGEFIFLQAVHPPGLTVGGQPVAVKMLPLPGGPCGLSLLY